MNSIGFITISALIIILISASRDVALGLIPNGKRAITPVPANMLALVPQPEGINEVIKKANADPLRDTVPLILKLSKRQKWQGKKLAAALKAGTLEETVRNNYNFFLNHIQYEQDPASTETVRSLRRTIHEGKGDCDCFTNSLSNILQNQNISHKLKVTAPPSDRAWGHIYIIVPTGSGKYLTLDPVVHQFNVEAPYSNSIEFNV